MENYREHTFKKDENTFIRIATASQEEQGYFTRNKDKGVGRSMTIELRFKGDLSKGERDQLGCTIIEDYDVVSLVYSITRLRPCVIGKYFFGFEEIDAETYITVFSLAGAPLKLKSTVTDFLNNLGLVDLYNELAGIKVDY